MIVCWVCAADELSDFSLYVVNVCEEFSLAVLIHQMCRISFQRCSKLLVLVSFFCFGDAWHGWFELGKLVYTLTITVAHCSCSKFIPGGVIYSNGPWGKSGKN